MLFCITFMFLFNILGNFYSDITAWVIIADVFFILTMIILEIMRRNGKISELNDSDFGGMTMLLCITFMLLFSILGIFDRGITAWVVIADIWFILTIIIFEVMKRTGKISELNNSTDS